MKALKQNYRLASLWLALTYSVVYDAYTMCNNRWEYRLILDKYIHKADQMQVLHAHNYSHFCNGCYHRNNSKGYHLAL